MQRTSKQAIFTSFIESDEEDYSSGRQVPVEKDPYLESATNGFIQQYLPGLDGTHACSYGRCLYQLSCMKDYDFIIGAHWDAPDGRVQVATGFSGEGFKFAPVI
ncbi:hypothetical protein FOZ63_018929, partial [Perkinsus olseni]